MLPILCLAVIGIVVWLISAEGAHGAAQIFLCVLLSALFAMNYFEPLANFLDGLLPTYKHYMDVVALVGLFGLAVFGLRTGVEYVTPTYIALPNMFDMVGKWAFAAMTGYLTMAFLLTALHTTPLPREFLGFKAEQPNFFGIAPDRQWLGFVQYVTEKGYSHAKFSDPVTKKAIPHMFDGQYARLVKSSGPDANLIWSSFPIRYAMRREKLEAGAAMANAPAPKPVTPPPATGPTPGQGGGGGGAAPPAAF